MEHIPREDSSILVFGLCRPLVDSVGMEEQERERRRQVVEKFQKAPFEEIAAHCGARVQWKSFPFNVSVQTFFLLFLLFLYVCTFVLSRPHYCRANSIRSLRLQSGKKQCLYWVDRQVVMMVMSTLSFSLTDPHRAHLEQFRQVMARVRVDLSPSTR